MKKTPTALDKHVASRVRLQRMLVGMSQEKLGEALGITFQQVQKYEKGTNRISGGRLQEIAGALGVQVPFFYEGMQTADEPNVHGFAEDAGAAYVADSAISAEGRQLNVAFARIRHPQVRQRIIALVETLAENQPPPAKRGRNLRQTAE